MTDPMLAVKNVSKRFGGLHALREASLAVEGGRGIHLLKLSLPPRGVNSACHVSVPVVAEHHQCVDLQMIGGGILSHRRSNARLCLKAFVAPVSHEQPMGRVAFPGLGRGECHRVTQGSQRAERKTLLEKPSSIDDSVHTPLVSRGDKRLIKSFTVRADPRERGTW